MNIYGGGKRSSKIDLLIASQDTHAIVYTRSCKNQKILSDLLDKISTQLGRLVWRSSVGYVYNAFVPLF